MSEEEKEVIRFLEKNVQGFDSVYLNAVYCESINRMKTILHLIKKKNKIIDLMSKELTNIIDATEEEIKEYFRKKVEEWK